MVNSKESKATKRKPIERKIHINRKIVQIVSAENLADPFIQSLTAKVFKGHLEGLGLHNISHLL